MKLSIHQKTNALKHSFAISRGAKTEAKTVICELSDGDITGRGECVPYPRYGESVTSVMAKIDAVRADIEAGITIEALQTLMPPGAARCAVDTALWDLMAKREQRHVWQLAGLPPPQPVETAITVSLDTPEAMGRAARGLGGKLLKLKLGGDGDLDRLKAVHAARPDARLIIDGNEGCSPTGFDRFCRLAADFGVVLIEQPFPVDADQPLAELTSPLAICADESVHTSEDIPRLKDRYQVVNVKLDKTGGLTEAIQLVQAARAANMGVMIGCMVAGSLSMAPAMLLAGLADYVDLDGPLWLAEDVPHGLHFENGLISPPAPELWG